MVSSGVSTGRAAAAAGVLMAAGVGGEWVTNPQQSDGTVTNTPLFAALLLVSTAGFALLLLAVRGLRAESVRRTRSARIGSNLSIMGAGLLTLFGLAVLGTGLLMGSPLELSFVAFALGMLLLSIGPVMWGLSLRRESPASGIWQLMVTSGAAAFAAIAIPVDPWHDVSPDGDVRIMDRARRAPASQPTRHGTRHEAVGPAVDLALGRAPAPRLT